MTPDQQAAANHAAHRDLTDRFTAWGLTDPAERARVVLADLVPRRLAPPEHIPALRPEQVADDASRAAVLAEIRATLASRRSPA